MAHASYIEIAEAYGSQRDQYERLARRLAESFRPALRASRIEAVVEYRAKDVLSFVKKALRNGYGDPLREIGDKAGVRVIVHYSADVERVVDIVRTKCEVLARESKLDALAYDQLGYLGVHLQVTAREETLAENAVDLAALQAEIQIHTKAQSAWAVVSHDLLYKSALDIPSDLKRTITRLVALVELFDGEVARFQEQLYEHPDYEEMQAIAPLDDLLVQFTERVPDKAMSALTMPALVRLFGVDPADLFARVVQPFVEENRERLEDIFTRYADDYRVTPLLFQPEAFLIFAALEQEPDHLVAAWPTDKLPRELLEAMAAVWGLDLAEYAAF